MPPLELHLRRNIAESGPSRILPVAHYTLASVRTGLQEAYTAVNKNDLSGAKESLIASLRSMLLVVVSSEDEATEVCLQKSALVVCLHFKQWRELITSAREYLIGVSVELARRMLEKEEPDNVQRNLELAAYFTRCQMQKAHLRLALRNAMSLNRKHNNHASAAAYARQLIDLDPDPKVIATVSVARFLARLVLHYF